MSVNPILIDVPMPIMTPRLLIRLVQFDDGAAMNEAKRETWEQLHQWMPWAKDMTSIDDDEITCRQTFAKSILREDLMMVGIRREDNLPVVYTGLHRFNWTIRKFEIGYWVRGSAQGQGYATESTNALVRYAFGALNARRVYICHAKGNEASARVIEKLHFQKEGIAQDDLDLPNGDIVARHNYALFDTKRLPALEVTWG